MVQDLELKFENVFALVLFLDFQSHIFAEHLVVSFINVA